MTNVLHIRKLCPGWQGLECREIPNLASFQNSCFVPGEDEQQKRERGGRSGTYRLQKEGNDS